MARAPSAWNTWRARSLYRADSRAPRSGPEPRPQAAPRTREVILSAGAFNTPQLLMLSGIGPAEQLSRFSIPVVADRPGVGRNLQDRYEVTVVTRMRQNFPLLEACSFAPPGKAAQPDPCYAEWLHGGGPYTTNGAVLGIIQRSAPSRPVSDLFIFGVPGYFKGYFPGYSDALRSENKDFFTWAVLKAHTTTAPARSRLRSADPRDPPEIDFHYFDEGNDTSGEDLASVVAGVAIRAQSDRAALRSRRTRGRGSHPRACGALRQRHRQFRPKRGLGPPRLLHRSHRARRTIRWRSWTASSGSMARRGLRVVDASVFPHIPGFFIVTPTYMISEKASDVILQAASRLRMRASI